MEPETIEADAVGRPVAQPVDVSPPDGMGELQPELQPEMTPAIGPDAPIEPEPEPQLHDDGHHIPPSHVDAGSVDMSNMPYKERRKLAQERSRAKARAEAARLEQERELQRQLDATGTNALIEARKKAERCETAPCSWPRAPIDTHFWHKLMCPRRNLTGMGCEQGGDRAAARAGAKPHHGRLAAAA